MRTQDYMVLIEKAAEQSKNNMYNAPDGVSAYVQHSVCNSPVPVGDQHEANAENHTQLPYHAHFNDILTEYPAWSSDANDIENTNQAQYRSDRQEIQTARSTINHCCNGAVQPTNHKNSQLFTK